MSSFFQISKKVKSTVFFSLLIATFFTVHTFAQNIELRLDLKKGSKHQISTQMINTNFVDASLQEESMKMDYTLNTEFEVLDKTSDGIHTIKALVSGIKAYMSAQGMEISYDSEDPETAQGMGAMMAQQFEPILNSSVTFKVNNRGVVVEKPDLDTDNPMLDQNLIDDMFMEMPEQKISVGDTWEKTETEEGQMSITLHYTVEAITDNQVTLSYYAGPGDMNMEQTDNQIQDLNIEINGKIVYDRKTGKSLSNNLSQNMSGSDPQQGDFFNVTEIKQSSN